MAADSTWKPATIKGGDCQFLSPAQPVVSKSIVNGQQSLFYTADSDVGRFVVGLTPFAPQIEPAMRRMILSQPGGQGIKHLLEATVSAFAKGGNAKVAATTFGVDRGLPAEFAVLKNSNLLLNMRVYVHPRRVYMFIASADDDNSLKFFNSVKIPSVLAPAK
jgi:hypothetical protein